MAIDHREQVQNNANSEQEGRNYVERIDTLNENSFNIDNLWKKEFEGILNKYGLTKKTKETKKVLGPLNVDENNDLAAVDKKQEKDTEKAREKLDATAIATGSNENIPIKEESISSNNIAQTENHISLAEFINIDPTKLEEDNGTKVAESDRFQSVMPS